MTKTLQILLVCIALFLSQAARAQVSTVSIPAGGFSISYKSDFSRENQRDTDQASAATTAGGKQTLSIAKSLTPDMLFGIDLSCAALSQVTDDLAPGFTEHGSLNKNSGEANAFVEIKRFGLTFRPSARLGFDDYRLNRPDTLFFGGVARSQSQGFHAGADLEVSTILPLSKSVFLRPTADLDYSYLTVDPFAESGAGLGDAVFNRVYDQRVTFQIGAAVATRLSLGETAWLTPYIQARYRHNFNTDPISTYASLIAMPVVSQNTVLSTAEEADGLIVDAGMFLAGASNWEFMANYEGKFLPSLTGQTYSIRAKISF